MALPVGKQAPDFELASQTGELVRLSEIAKGSTVVLFFYPKDDTAGCTAEVCAFRDSYDVFRDAGAEVIGISSDDVKSHRAFAHKHGLSFRILSDPGGRVRKLYEVKDTIPFLIPGRETFVIDRERIIRHHFSSQLRAAAHVAEALTIVGELAGTPPAR
jgi:thioredoxin-dependent peroxiredoxin